MEFSDLLSFTITQCGQRLSAFFLSFLTLWHKYNGKAKVTSDRARRNGYGCRTMVSANKLNFKKKGECIMIKMRKIIVRVLKCLICFLTGGFANKKKDGGEDAAC